MYSSHRPDPNLVLVLIANLNLAKSLHRVSLLLVVVISANGLQLFQGLGDVVVAVVVGALAGVV